MNSDPNEMSDAPEARWTKARNMPWTVGQELRRRLAWLLVRDRSPHHEEWENEPVRPAFILARTAITMPTYCHGRTRTK